jgi:hypothetical protein
MFIGYRSSIQIGIYQISSTRTFKIEQCLLTFSSSTGADQQQQLNDYWQLLAEKYHFHTDHTLIHNETSEIVNKCLHG